MSLATTAAFSPLPPCSITITIAISGFLIGAYPPNKAFAEPVATSAVPVYPATSTLFLPKT